MQQSWWRSDGSGRIFQRLARGLDRVWGWLQRVVGASPPAGGPARRRPGAVGGLWLRLGGLAIGLLAAQGAPAATFCPWFGGDHCYTRRMDVACSDGAQQSTVLVAYTLATGRAFDSEGAARCGPSFVLNQFENAEEATQTAVWRNIKVRGGGRLLTSCQMTWEAGNLHGEQTVVCAGGGEWVAVTIHPAE